MNTEKKCENCGEPSSKVDLETMPCCGGQLCWDFCLYTEPNTCPLCGAKIQVEQKDPVTGEAYVLLEKYQEDPGCSPAGEPNPPAKLDEGDILNILLRHGDLLTCYNCGEKLIEVSPKDDVVAEMCLEPGRNNYPREPDEPAEIYFRCAACIKERDARQKVSNEKEQRRYDNSKDEKEI